MEMRGRFGSKLKSRGLTPNLVLLRPVSISCHNIGINRTSLGTSLDQMAPHFCGSSLNLSVPVLVTLPSTWTSLGCSLCQNFNFKWWRCYSMKAQAVKELFLKFVEDVKVLWNLKDVKVWKILKNKRLYCSFLW